MNYTRNKQLIFRNKSCQKKYLNLMNKISKVYIKSSYKNFFMKIKVSHLDLATYLK